MEAANRGAYNAGGRTIGLNITIPWEQKPNPYITPELQFEFRYFLTRKFWFFSLARAIIVFPGGFGTLDELCEMITMLQTGKNDHNIPIILYGSEFWKNVLNFETLVNFGTVSTEDLDIFHTIDDINEAYDYITEEMQKRFMTKTTKE